MRPKSYSDKPPEKCCATCKFAHLVAYKLDLLCFHGDTIEVTGNQEYPVRADYIDMCGEEVGMLEGDAYDKVWAGRVVDGSGVCNEWVPCEG